MAVLRDADWVAQDRVAAAVIGPCREVLWAIAGQPVRSSQLGARRTFIPIPKSTCCASCGRAYEGGSN